MGGTDTITGFCISNVRMISVRLLVVAVAVKAMTLMFSGMTLRTSPNLENSRRKLSPLLKNIERMGNDTVVVHRYTE